MKNKFLVFTFVSLLSTFCFAQGANRIVRAKKSDVQSPVRQSKINYERKSFVFVGGYDLRFERDQEQQMANRSMFNLAGGFQMTPWIGFIEYAEFSEITGAGTLQVQRKVQSALGWAYWEATDLDRLTPFIGAGAGGLRSTVETKFEGAVSESTGEWEPVLAGALGLRLFSRSHIWLSAEGRLYKSSKLDPDPMLGALFRFGFLF